MRQKLLALNWAGAGKAGAVLQILLAALTKALRLACSGFPKNRPVELFRIFCKV